MNTASPKRKSKPKRKHKPKHFVNEKGLKLKEKYLTSQRMYELTRYQNDKEEPNLKKKNYDQRLRFLRQQAHGK